MYTRPKHSDDLEELLHRQLSDFAPEAPERVWARIETRLPGRRRPALRWIAWIAALALLGGLLRHNPRKTPPASAPRVQVPVAQAIAVPAAPEPAHEMPRAAAPSFVPVGHISKSPAPATPRASGSDGLAAVLISAVQPLPADGAAALLPAEIMAARSAVIAPQRESDLPHLLLPAIKHRAGRLTLGLSAGPVWIRHSGTPAHTHHPGASNFARHDDRIAAGWQQGLVLGYQPAPHWRLSTGLQHRQISQGSGHSATLRLMDGTWVNPHNPGPKELEYRYSLHSGGTESRVTVRIAQADTLGSLAADEPFALDMHTSRTVADWVLPLTVQRIFSRGRWRGYLEAGGQLNLPARTTVRVMHFTEECLQFCSDNGLVPSLTVEERRNKTFYWQAGAGVEYRLTPRWSAGVAPALFGKKDITGFSLHTTLNYRL